MSLKNSKRKEIIKSVMSLGLCGVLLAGGTLAYFTKTLSSEKNSIRTESMVMEVDGDIGSTGQIFNYITDGSVKEGKPLTKKITVKNTGDLGFTYQLKMTGQISKENEYLTKAMKVYLHDDEGSYGSPDEEIGTLYDVLQGNTAPKNIYVRNGFSKTKFVTVVLPENKNGGYEADIYSGKILDDITMTVTAISNN